MEVGEVFQIYPEVKEIDELYMRSNELLVVKRALELSLLQVWGIWVKLPPTTIFQVLGGW